jgi:acetyl esterase/lipase
MKTLSVAAMLLLTACMAAAQATSAGNPPPLPPGPNWGLEFYGHYQISPNIVYLTASDYKNTLDIWTRRDAQSPQPTVVFIHGGGWTGGTKEAGIGFLLPYIAMGWNAVNVDYRVARVAHAPAAVEDCLCALRWIAANAQKYRIDVSRLVVTGDSAGGHLSLTTGMMPANPEVDSLCPGPPLPKVAAIVDFYGITDVNELLDGPNKRAYAVTWVADSPNKAEIAKHVSPLEYVRGGLPPTMIIHGDADPVVPYQQSVRLKSALDKVGVPNELYTVPGGKHGFFAAEQYVPLYGAIKRFLKSQGLPVQ